LIIKNFIKPAKEKKNQKWQKNLQSFLMSLRVH
jgi:hypothetical protein